MRLQEGKLLGFECAQRYLCSFPFVDSTAAIILKMGPFSLDDPKDYSVDVRVSDGGRPVQTSITKLAIEVCCAGTHTADSSEGLIVKKS